MYEKFFPLGMDVQIMPRAIINADVKIGDNAFVAAGDFVVQDIKKNMPYKPPTVPIKILKYDSCVGSLYY